AIDLDLTILELQEHAAVEDAAALIVGDEILDDDPSHFGAHLAEHVDHQVVRQRPLARDARYPCRDAVGLVGADPDREKAADALRLKQNDVLIREHVDADRLHRARHEHHHKPTPYKRPQGVCLSRCSSSETSSTRLRAPEKEQQSAAAEESEEGSEVCDVLGRL